jgi:hypothetical protein
MLRDQTKDVTEEPLPERWLDLMRSLDEQRRASSHPKSPEELEGRRTSLPRT